MCNRSIVLFGAGKIGQEALKLLGRDHIAFFCDNNASLHGKYIEGVKVISFGELLTFHQDYQVIITLRDIVKVLAVEAQLKGSGIPFSLFEQNVDTFRNAKEAFSYIYAHDIWGKETGNKQKFFSGIGSHDDAIIKPYISLVQNIIRCNKIRNIVEIGCGDFTIMREILDHSGKITCSYLGMDVVDELVEYNNEHFGDERIKFIVMDASDEKSKMPLGDLLIIRQVLQHLDNQSIERIMQKADKFPIVLVTEHIYEGRDVVFNVDKPINGDIRLYRKSGVYLDEAPYCYKNMVHLLEIEASGGAIRTSLILNNVK